MNENCIRCVLDKRVSKLCVDHEALLEETISLCNECADFFKTHYYSFVQNKYM